MNQYSGVLIPIVAMLIPIVAIIAGAFNQAQKRRIRADQQMAMLARGVPLAEIEAFQQRTAPVDSEERSIKDPMRALGNARRTAMVLIPLGIGIGFLVDYNLQKRELSRFGLEVAADKS